MDLQEFNDKFTRATNELIQTFSTEAEKNSVIPMIADTTSSTSYVEKIISVEDSIPAEFVPEGSVVPEQKLDQGYVVWLDPQKSTQKINVTIEAMKKASMSSDFDTSVMEIVDMQVRSAIAKTYNLREKTALLPYANGFTTATTPDGELFFSATHKYKTGGQFSNLVSAGALDLAKIAEAEKLAGFMTAPNGDPLSLNLKSILVKKGSDAHTAARKIFLPNGMQYKPVSIGDVDLYIGGSYTIIATPFLPSTFGNNGNGYAFLADFSSILSEYKSPVKCATLEAPNLVGSYQRDPSTANFYSFTNGIFRTGIKGLPIGIIGGVGA